MTPRPARHSDIAVLVSYIRDFHSQSPWKTLEFSQARTKLSFQTMLADPNQCVFLHDYGAIGGMLSQFPFGPGTFAQEVFWWAERDGLSLFRAFESWAEEQGASAISMAALPDSRVRTIYQRRGYRRAEQFYLKVL